MKSWREHAHLAAVDGAVAGDHAVAVRAVLLQAERASSGAGRARRARRTSPRRAAARSARGRSSCPWRAASRPPAPSRRAPPRRGGAPGRRACRRSCGCRCRLGVMRVILAIVQKIAAVQSVCFDNSTAEAGGMSGSPYTDLDRPPLSAARLRRALTAPNGPGPGWSCVPRPARQTPTWPRPPGPTSPRAWSWSPSGRPKGAAGAVGSGVAGAGRHRHERPAAARRGRAGPRLAAGGTHGVRVAAVAGRRGAGRGGGPAGRAGSHPQVAERPAD